MKDIEIGSGLKIPASATYDQLVEWGTNLARIEKGMQWAIGDWYNAIPSDARGRPFDEMKSEMCAECGLDFKTAQRNARVARFFSGEPRGAIGYARARELSVEGLTEAQRRQLAERAIRVNWTVREVAAHRDEMLGKPPKEPEPTGDWEKDLDRTLNGMPKGVSGKAKSAIKGMYRRMASDFSSQVRAEVTKRVRVERKKVSELEHQLEADKKRLAVKLQGARVLMTEREWRSVIQFVHPDKHPDRHEQAEKVFAIMNRFQGMW